MIELNWTFLVQMVNFLVLMFVLNKILYKPILKILDERDKKIVGGQEEIKQVEEESHRMFAEYTDKIYTGRVEALEAKNSARKAAEAQANEIIVEARKKAEEMIAQVRLEMAQEVEKAKKDIETELGSMAASIAGRVLGREAL
ncbi:MAG: F0F1 ATP synthase subunit B [Thermodesulfobacteriota bacterium]|nr:F0F1 ATP synthase subunit B [Thermodesulfobacteriota bacterium]